MPLLETGQIFAGRYRIVQRLAEGGMGAIFEAEHLGTERRVALKLLFPHIMSVASAREKFELEAKVAARVNSPHIVQVLDAGFDEASQSPYLVMELLRGDTLGAMIKERGAASARETVVLLRQVAAGLDAAHGYKDASGVAMPIVHRDLKPENLFVTVDRDGSRLVKILDFGIAKVLSDTGNISQEVRGTPLYMAFEQVTASRLSPATDIWALGLIAYYVLTGERYWRSARAEGAGVQSLFAEILTLPLEAPSARMQQQGLQHSLGDAFDAWLLKCIDREPSRRFGSAGETIEALARALAQPVVASGPVIAAATSSPSRTATFHGPPLHGQGPKAFQAGTAPSLSAVERGGVGARDGLPRRLIAASLGMGALLVLGGLYWVVSSGDTPSQGTEEAATAVTPASEKSGSGSVVPTTSGAAGGVAPSEVGSPQVTQHEPTIAPILAPATRDAGAPRAPGDYPMPTWPPPRLPGEEAEGSTAEKPSENPSKPGGSVSSNPRGSSPSVSNHSVSSPAGRAGSSDTAAKPSKPAVKPAPKPAKFNPYDMH